MIEKYGLDNEDDDAKPENDNDDGDDDDGKELKKLVQHCSHWAINIHLICHSIGWPPCFSHCCERSVGHSNEVLL